MLRPIIDALKSFDDRGLAVIVEHEGIDPRFIAAHVLPVLQSLKCSIDHYYNDLEQSYFIVDRMSEIDYPSVIIPLADVELKHKCDCCGRVSAFGLMTHVENVDAEFDGFACEDCVKNVLPKIANSRKCCCCHNAFSPDQMVHFDVFENAVNCWVCQDCMKASGHRTPVDILIQVANDYLMINADVLIKYDVDVLQWAIDEARRTDK